MKYNRLRMAAVTTVAAAAGALVAASPADATINWCNAGTSAVTNSGWAFCSGTAPSAYRVNLTCYRWSTGATLTKYGPWILAGGTANSEAYCPSTHEAWSAVAEYNP